MNIYLLKNFTGARSILLEEELIELADNSFHAYTLEPCAEEGYVPIDTIEMAIEYFRDTYYTCYEISNVQVKQIT